MKLVTLAALLIGIALYAAPTGAQTAPTGNIKVSFYSGLSKALDTRYVYHLPVKDDRVWVAGKPYIVARRELRFTTENTARVFVTPLAATAR